MLLPCPYCKGKPKLIRVGNYKEHIVYICSDCYRTPVHYDEASLSIVQATRIWNMRTYEVFNKM